MPEEPRFQLSDVLREEYVRLHGDLPAATAAALDAEESESGKLKLLYAAIHALNADPLKARTALCFSGGGIRSATFALGLMQRLAGFNLLHQFHYLSTVSGGGYIGSWLSSFVRRHPGGIGAVAQEITGQTAAPRDPLAPEIKPIQWLRRFSNYLTPKLGLMSADTWAFVGSYVRNLVLVWLIFVPFLAAILALPRLGMALLHAQSASTTADWTRNAAAALIFLGTGILALTRPVSYKKAGRLTNGRFLQVVLLPYTLAAVLLVAYWVGRKAPDRFELRSWSIIFVGFIAINVASALIYMIRYFVQMRRQRQRNVRSDSSPFMYALKKLALEVVASAIAGAVGAALMYITALKLFNNPLTHVQPATLDTWKTLPLQWSGAPGAFFLCFGVPLVLGILFLQATIFVGLASWFNEEYDREWWGRAAGWVLFASVAWIVAAAISIYGPLAIYYMPKFYAALTGASGIVAILLGKSGATGATDRERDEKTGAVQTGVSIGLGVAGPLFAIAILALISLCTSRILLAIDKPPRIAPEDVAVAAAGTYQFRDTFLPKVAAGTGNFETKRFPALDKADIAAIEHLLSIDRTRLREGAVLVFGLALFSIIVSFFVGANQFSMHGLYRNRLIRGYLGGPRKKRLPNTFTGFDPTDNLQMSMLRPEIFLPSTFTSITRHGPKIVATSGLGIQTQTIDAVKAAAAAPARQDLADRAEELLADDLNRAIDSLVLAQKGQKPQAVANREALEKQFPGAFSPMTIHQRPLHVVNTTLNLVNGADLAWQERKGAPFAISPLYSGNPSSTIGYRATRVYGGPAGVSLGTAVAISGAAASPNMGYNSSPALSFLLTLFNVRLGWWLGNPSKPSYSRKNPSNTLKTILDEAFGLTDAEHNYVYLSDGAHFDNLGLYEMVLRRCHCIIVSDAGADPEFGFGDLGNAIRKIRIDLGIDIEITGMGLFPRSKKDPSHPKYCAVAKIRYSQIDGEDAKDGCLLYLKPAFYGTEPKDVYTYASTYAAFPHQSTGDQWFSESQFESYRQLGFFATGEVGNHKPEFTTVCDLIKEADAYLRDKPEKYPDPPPLVC